MRRSGNSHLVGYGRKFKYVVLILAAAIIPFEEVFASSSISRGFPFCSNSRHKLSGWGRIATPIQSGSKVLLVSGTTDIFNKFNIPRGGAESEEDEYDEDDDSEEVEDDYDDNAVQVEESEDEYDTEEDEYDDETDVQEADNSIEAQVETYDEPLVPSPMTQLYATFGVMILSKRVDLYSPIIVRIARYAFISYLVALQLFLLFVRIKAKQINDRTPISLSNPISSLLQAQLGGGDDASGGGLVKNLASSFLSNKSTIMEYDLQQAKSMQGGLVFNMAFMWFLHFRMDQIQPLLIQSANGIINMFYSPLFQVYVLGRNLERPFKNPAMNQAAATAEEDTEAQSELTETIKDEANVTEEDTQENIAEEEEVYEDESTENDSGEEDSDTEEEEEDE